MTDNLMTGSIRPAGKKDVTMTIVGLDFNTPDSFIFDCLNKFGVVVNQPVLYSKYDTGPWKETRLGYYDVTARLILLMIC